MPTPSDSTDELALQLDPRFERPTHTICPPDADRPAQWRVEVLDRMGDTSADGEIHDGRPELEHSLHTTADSPGLISTTYNPGLELEPGKMPEQMQGMEPAEPSTPSLGASPSKSYVEDKESEQIQQPPPVSSALDLQYSARYGIDSTRVGLH
jgi:hypothetical protein